MDSKSINQFLNQLPDEDIEIKGNLQTNELFVNGKKVSLNKSLKVRNHSPSGFNWGYGGSGPAQTALAILLLYVDQGSAIAHHQAFKFGWVGALPQSDFYQKINLRQVMKRIFMKDELSANSITNVPG